MHVAIIGAGMAGLACAQHLVGNGLAVRLFDKGKRPGGRLASVAIGGKAWDLGALGFVAGAAEFRRQVTKWRGNGLLAVRDARNPILLAGVPFMAALVEAQCAGLDIRFGARIFSIERSPEGWHVSGCDFKEGPFSALVIAVPAEQAAALLSLQDLAMARSAALVRSTPCWAVMAAFSEPLPLGEAMIFDGPPFATIARSRQAPSQDGHECWTLHADADWSREHLEREREDVAELLVASLAKLLGSSLPPMSFAKAHRWRFAIPRGGPGTPLWNDRLRLGACGDWCLGSDVEAAWLSGRRLGRQVTRALETSVAGGAARGNSSIGLAPVGLDGLSISPGRNGV